MNGTDLQDRGPWLTQTRVGERYGVTTMTLWRWQFDKRLSYMGFPPSVKIGARRYWRLRDLTDWELQQATRCPRGQRAVLAKAAA